MSEHESININIDRYMDLQRIINAADPVKEAKNQMKAVKAKLEAAGIVIEDITIE